MGFNLTSEQIKDTYEQLVQISGSTLVNGLGNTFNVLVPSSSHSAYAVSALSASYAVSASFEIIKEVSSSYADTASLADFATTAGSSTTSVSASHALYANQAGTADSATTATSASYALTASFAANATIPTLQQVTDEGATTDNDIVFTNPNGNQQIFMSGSTLSSTRDLILRGNADYITTFDNGGLFGAEIVEANIFTMLNGFGGSHTFASNLGTSVQIKGSGSLGLRIVGGGNTTSTSTIFFRPGGTSMASMRDTYFNVAVPMTASSNIRAIGGFIGDLTGTASFALTASFLEGGIPQPGLVLGSTATSLKSVLTTNTASAVSNGSVAIGDNARAGASAAFGAGNISIGRNASTPTVTNGTIAIGDAAKASTNGGQAIVIGTNAEASSSAIVIGYNAKVFSNSTGTIVIGTNANSIDDNRNNSVIIGANATSYQNGVAIGANAFSIESAVAIGLSAQNGNNYGVAVGASANSGDLYGIAIGYQSTAGNDSIAIGYGVSATTANEINIGDIFRYNNTSSGSIQLMSSVSTPTRALSAVSSNVAVDGSLSNFFTLAAGGNAWTISNPTNLMNGITYIIKITNGANLLWGSNYNFEGGVAPSLSSGTDLVSFASFGDGQLYCSYLLNLS